MTAGIEMRVLARFEKYPEEVFVQSVDFTDVMVEPGVTINSATVTASDSEGTDQTANVIQGVPTVEGSVVLYRVRQGDPGFTYTIHVQANLSSGASFVQRLAMRVLQEY